MPARASIRQWLSYSFDVQCATKSELLLVSFSCAHDGFEMNSTLLNDRICSLKFGLPIAASVRWCSGRGIQSSVAA